VEEVVVRTNGLTKRYGSRTVLNNVNISLERGKIYGFIGQNGAGKTTLIRTIDGLIYPTGGSIELFGQSEKGRLIEARKRIGTVCEHAGLHGNYSARANIKMNMYMRGIDDESLIESTINSVGLAGVGKKKFKDYSMGMKQRLAIGCAMLSGPDLLLLDEPINGLDPIGIVEIRNLLKNLNQKYGVTILISSHILSELHELATDYIIIDQGNIIDSLSAEELESRCRRQIVIRTDEIPRVIEVLNSNNISEYTVFQDTITVYAPVNPDDLAFTLFNQKIFLKEYHNRQESLEDYFISLLGGGYRG
jgi:ABC-2 type transport system ATP-binding protein